MKQLIYIAGFVLLASACGTQQKETEPAVAATTAADSSTVTLSAAQRANAAIVTGKAELRNMHRSLKVSGMVDVPPQNIVSISFPLGGYLKKTSLIPGMRISRGAVLAVLEDPQYIQLQQDYLSAKSRLAYLETDYQRQKGLNETKATSDKALQLVQSEYNSQKILVRSLAEKLRLIGLNPDRLTENNISRSIALPSPISGFVSKVNVNTGKYVSPTDVLFELINPDDLHLTLTVFENDAASLAKGQKLSCYTNAQPNQLYTATVYLVAPSIGEERSTEVHCHFDREIRDLSPGTFMNASIELNRAQVMAVPDAAVVKWEGHFYVFAEEAENRFRLTPVETGNSSDGYVEIQSGLPDQPIVLQNAYTLLMKMKNNAEED